ncbi:hypothetical protein AAAT63_14460, partial [Dorea ammoniilytica]
GENKKIAFEVIGSQTAVGSSSNTYVLEWGNVDKDNYSLSEDLGILKVTEQSIDPGTEEEPNPSYDGIQINSPSNKVYNGKKHQWSPTVTDKNNNVLTAGTDYEVSYDTDNFVNVKTITVTITGKGNYAGTVIRVYKITPAEISITTNTADKPYDGTPLTAPGQIDGLVDGEEVSFKVTGSQTDVGSSPNSYTIEWNKNAKEKNYTIVSKVIGTLTVTNSEKEIVVTTTGGTFEYDGASHGADVIVSELPKGYMLKKAESTATATNVKDGVVKATADQLVIVNQKGEDVTNGLNIRYVDGEIKITPKEITVITPDATKVYDGTPLTAEGKVTGLVNGEKVSFETIGNQTNVGSSKNAYELKWNKNAAESNYTVAKSIGILKVTEQSIDPGTEEEPNPSYKGITINDPKD